MATTTTNDSINLRVTGELRQFVREQTGPQGLYETPSEYIRDLIRRDKAARDAAQIRKSIIAGYEDLAQGRFFKSTGDFKKDRKLAEKTWMAYFLTPNAYGDLNAIYEYSLEKFGAETANQYVADIYAKFALLGDKPSLGLSRRKRAAPFLMYPARDHFIVYERVDNDTYVVSVLSQVRDVEAIIAAVGKELKAEIEMIRSRTN